MMGRGVGGTTWSLATVVGLDFNLDKVRYGNQQFAIRVTLLEVYPKLQSRWHKTKHSINTKYTNTHTPIPNAGSRGVGTSDLAS